MVSSSTRKWLGSISLAGLLLASSLPALASAESDTAASRTPAKPLLAASATVPTETYTETVRKQMKWIASPVKTDESVESAPAPEPAQTPIPVPANEPVAVAETSTQASQEVQILKQAQPAVRDTEPVQAAEAPKQQVSRSSSSTLADNALSLAGVPYVFGGNTRNGFDCSGYTQYVFEGSGISLPRTSQAQFKVGSSVTKDELQTGDLVFFSTYAKGASHVGIYIGGGKFVHASNSGVRTTSLSDGYYESRYLGARRVN